MQAGLVAEAGPVLPVEAPERAGLAVDPVLAAEHPVESVQVGLAVEAGLVLPVERPDPAVQVVGQVYQPDRVGLAVFLSRCFADLSGEASIRIWADSLP